MKTTRYLFILLILSFASCKTVELTHFPRTENFYAIDFSPYSAKNFLFTPEKYTGDYQSIALLQIEVLPEATKQKFVTEEDKFSWHEPEVKFSWKVEYIDFNEVLKLLYEKCKTLGADALVNFNSEPIVESHTLLMPALYRNGYRISGFAIKRK